MVTTRTRFTYQYRMFAPIDGAYDRIHYQHIEPAILQITEIKYLTAYLYWLMQSAISRMPRKILQDISDSHCPRNMRNVLLDILEC
jgi:hypothetical protein